MATARQNGGLSTVAGIKIIDPFGSYVLGFQTGFNSEAEGVYDIFKSLGSNPTVSALYAIEPWCASNPSKKFSDGLLNLAGKIRTAIKR
jgi:hypothetical protein